MDDFRPKFPLGGRRRWTKRRIANTAISAFGIACLLVAMLIVFCEITGQVPVFDTTTPWEYQRK